MTASELLRQAADIVRTRWHQGGRKPNDDKVCAMDALHEAWCLRPDAGEDNGFPLFSRACDKLRTVIEPMNLAEPDGNPDNARSIIWFNDHEGRTVEQIVAAMEAAAQIPDPE